MMEGRGNEGREGRNAANEEQKYVPSMTKKRNKGMKEERNNEYRKSQNAAKVSNEHQRDENT